MLYMIYGEDKPDSREQRQAGRPAHLERLKTLQQEGRLILAGPLPAIDNIDPGPAGFGGSLVVAEFPSLALAQVWAETDPYAAIGVYAKITVKPFKKVFPA